MSPIRTDATRLDLFAAASRLDPAPNAQATGPQAFSDFSAFAGADASVRLGAGAASLDPQHAARAVIAFIAEG